jgi:hypothetical protein
MTFAQMVKNSVTAPSDARALFKPTPVRRAAPTAERLSRLRALVLLSGSVRAKAWSSALGRSIMDLPLERGRTLVSHWVEQAAALAGLTGAGRLDMQVLVDRFSIAPEASDVHAVSLDADHIVGLRIERDLLEYRGTGGLLRDLSLYCDEQDYLLVASGAQVLTESLEFVTAALADKGKDVALLAHDDGTPSGLMWVRCGCLRAIPEVGFIDMKEQALPQIARRHDVAVLRRRPPGIPFQSPAEYLAAVRTHHLRKQVDARLGDPFAEDWRPAFSLVEEGAEVDPSARVHDSVVLRGGRVRPGAVVVRSLIGPAGVARTGRCIVDQFLNTSALVPQFRA